MRSYKVPPETYVPFNFAHFVVRRMFTEYLRYPLPEHVRSDRKNRISFGRLNKFLFFHAINKYRRNLIIDNSRHLRGRLISRRHGADNGAIRNAASYIMHPSTDLCFRRRGELPEVYVANYARRLNSNYVT